MSIYQNESNVLRFRRTVDFVRTGETVFDVGFGRGYLCGLLLRDRGVAAYYGIDVVPSFVDYVHNMLDTNGFSGENVHVTTGDLYALERETVTATGATVVICCEVLEHLPDPEKALRTLADALPTGADLIFSVPLYGRLEAVWGHCTVYDMARLRAMCHAAGLYVHHVEPLANTWTYVVASRSPEPSERVREAVGLSRPDATTALTSEYDFRPVERSQIRLGRWVLRTDCTITHAADGDVRCEAVGKDPDTADTGGQYAGVAFPVEGLSALRIRLGFPDAAPIERVFVDLHNGRNRIARWQWRPKPRQLESGKVRRYAFRPGQPTSPFSYQATRPSTKVDRVEVFVQIAPSQQTSFRFGAAYLPAG
jgi:SAM-dependent methyltransferase